MIKKIVCDFEDVGDFVEFFIGNELDECYIKVPFIHETIKTNPYPGDLSSERDWKFNAYLYEEGRKPLNNINNYVYIEPKTEVTLIFTEEKK